MKPEPHLWIRRDDLRREDRPREFWPWRDAEYTVFWRQPEGLDGESFNGCFRN